MLIIATLIAVLAAALHVGVFIMQTAGWRRRAVWHRFGVTSQAEADSAAPLAFGLGFVDLFLAIGLIVGVVFVGIGWPGAGLALVVFTLACMVANAIVLIIGKRRRGVRMALVKGIVPLAALVLVFFV